MKKLIFNGDLEKEIKSSDINYVNRCEILLRLFITFVLMPVLSIPLSVIGSLFGGENLFVYGTSAIIAVSLTQVISYFSKSNKERSEKIVKRASRVISILLDIMKEKGVDVSRENLINSNIVKSVNKRQVIFLEEKAKDDTLVVPNVIGKKFITDYYMLDRKGKIQVLRQIKEKFLLENKLNVRRSTYLLDSDEIVDYDEARKVYRKR